jgi:hypothetical protein
MDAVSVTRCRTVRAICPPPQAHVPPPTRSDKETVSKTVSETWQEFEDHLAKETWEGWEENLSCDMMDAWDEYADRPGACAAA